MSVEPEGKTVIPKITSPRFQGKKGKPLTAIEIEFVRLRNEENLPRAAIAERLNISESYARDLRKQVLAKGIALRDDPNTRRKPKPRDVHPKVAGIVSLYLRGLSMHAAYQQYVGKKVGLDVATSFFGQKRVKDEIDFQREIARKATRYDAVIALAEMNDVAQFCREQRNAMALVKVTELKARLNGLLIDRQHVSIEERPSISKVLASIDSRLSMGLDAKDITPLPEQLSEARAPSMRLPEVPVPAREHMPARKHSIIDAEEVR